MASPTKYETDKRGNVINPPIIPEYERKIREAQDRADTDAIAEISKEYESERKKLAEATNRRNARENGGS